MIWTRRRSAPRAERATLSLASKGGANRAGRTMKPPLGRSHPGTTLPPAWLRDDAKGDHAPDASRVSRGVLNGCWVSSRLTRGLASIRRSPGMPRPPVAADGTRRVFRPACGRAEQGRSVRSCIASPTPAGRPPPRNPQSAGGPRTPPDRSDGSAPPCGSVAAGGAGCIGGGSTGCAKTLGKRQSEVDHSATHPDDLPSGREGHGRQ